MNELMNQLLALLHNDFGPDHWSNAVLPEEAAPLAQALSPDDWQELAAMTPSRTVGWCTRLADAAMSAGHLAAVPALVAMLRRAEPELGVAAARALLDIGYEWSPAETLLADIDRHLASQPHDPAPLRRLRGRLPA